MIRFGDFVVPTELRSSGKMRVLPFDYGQGQNDGNLSCLGMGHQNLAPWPEVSTFGQFFRVRHICDEWQE